MQKTFIEILRSSVDERRTLFETVAAHLEAKGDRREGMGSDVRNMQHISDVLDLTARPHFTVKRYCLWRVDISEEFQSRTAGL